MKQMEKELYCLFNFGISPSRAHAIFFLDIACKSRYDFFRRYIVEVAFVLWS